MEFGLYAYGLMWFILDWLKIRWIPNSPLRHFRLPENHCSDFDGVGANWQKVFLCTQLGCKCGGVVSFVFRQHQALDFMPMGIGARCKVCQQAA